MEPQYSYQSAPGNMPLMPPMEPKLIPGMMQGGMPVAAQQLQGQGRNGDSMLVHMTPGEVKGLQALAMSQGGSLTINPATGLPEANILKRFLPMILGAGLVMTGVGAPLAAGLVGAGYGVAKGSLKEGLMAGLGAYGGAGLAAGLMGAGASAASAAAPTAVAAPAASAPGIAAATPSIMPTAASSAVPGTFTEAARTALAPAATAVPATAAPSFMGNLAQAGKGVEALTSSAGREAFKAALPAYSGTAATMAGLGALSQPAKGPSPLQANLRPYEFAWNPNTEAYENPPSPGDTSERRYFNPTFTPLPVMRAASGGEVNPEDEMTQDGGYAAGGQTGLDALAKRRKSLKGDPYYKFAQDRRDSSMEAAVDQNFAAGGLPPRFLSGGGDGMSDSIRANIDGKQEARLADGEFVVPADVVSHLGNGSSKAGAKKLYAMMDKIRKARTGKTRQAPEVNAAKYMPA